MNSLITRLRFSPTRAAAAVLLGMLLGSAPLVQAEVQEYEGFSYSGTTLNAQNGGTGWGTNLWLDADSDTPLSNDTISLAFPGNVTHVPAGGRVVFSVAGEAERRLGTSISLAVEGITYYCAALVKRQGDVRFEFIDNGTNIRWRFGGAGDSSTNAGFAGISGDVFATNIFPIGETVYVVAKLTTRSAAAPGDEFRLNVYRAGDAVPLTEPSTWQVSGAQNSGVVLTRFQIRNMSDLPAEVDEIRIGTNYADVVTGPIGGPPNVTVQPAPATVYVGGNAQFVTDAAGAMPLHFQWNRNGSPLPGQTASTLVLTNIQFAQAGNYTCTVSNWIGSTNSLAALLSVLPIADITTGLKAMWHFDEKTGLVAYDASANHNDGTLFNYAGDDSQWIAHNNEYAASNNSGAIDFNRTMTNFVEVPHSASIGADLASHFSIAAWIRPRANLANTSTSGGARLLEKENSIFLLQGTGDPGGMNVLVKKGGVNTVAGCGETLLANRWYHVVGTYDGITLRMYLDGVLKTNKPVAAPLDTTTLPLHIGADYDPATGRGSAYFDGAVDEVGIWERPLSQVEVEQLAGQSGPPTFLEQPQSLARYVGGSAVFQVRAKGQPPLRYLWYHGTNEIRSATSPTLTLSDVQLADAGDYRCKISNDVSEQFSDMATLTVIPATNITDGIAALWHFNESSGLTVADASANSLNGTLVDYADTTSQWIAGQIGGALNFDGLSNRVVVSNSAPLQLSSDVTCAFWIRPTTYGSVHDAGNYLFNIGRVLSKGAYFSVEVVDNPGSVRASITANGVPAPQQYILELNQWQHFAVVISGGFVSFYKNGFRLGDPAPFTFGATNANPVVLGSLGESLIATNLLMFSGGMDEVGMWNRKLSETEILSLASRDIAGPPVIVTQPQSASRYVGATVSFQVDATGKRPVTYQWQHNDVPIPDSNTNQLVLTNLTLADAGNYTATVQNDLGQAATTPPAVLTVQVITNITTGLIAYWPMDETSGTTLRDLSGRGHNAAITNATAVPDKLGVVGGAFDFDGVDDFAIVPHAPDLNLDGQATISAWINPRSFGVTGSGGYGRILRKDVNYDLTVYSGAGNTLRLYGVNKISYDALPNAVITNQWQHVAVVVKDGTIQFFRNGRSLANPMPGLLGPAVTADLIIGNFGPDLSINRIFNGLMDELGLWDRALSAAEVDGIYQNGLLGHGLNAEYVPFAIREISFPTPSQIKLVFFTPYLGLDYAIHGRSDLEAGSWIDQSTATFTPLGNGLIHAVFAKPAADAYFRVAALPKPPIFADGFETGGPGWTHGGSGDNWQVGTPVNGPGAAYAGTNVYATSLTGNVEPFSDNYLRSPAINLTGVTRATLTFQEWRNVDTDPLFHGTIVNVLDANTLGLITQLSVQAGATAGWQPRTLPLPSQALGKNIRLEFKLYCDNFNLLEGWYIDDVKVLPE